ncbi:MAG: saccharopine dehydrogenase NADP-binding domain-containing protein [Bacteroidetes bacterium]|nr:saccharopine dehydrogenase NADP-binding domain-containing protein [Bacteroidota bacterium]
MKQILLFGAGKSATCLIDFLIKESATNGWSFVLADGNLETARAKIGTASHAKAIAVDVQNETARKQLVNSADIVISLLPPTLHFLVAHDCVLLKKSLLTASYVDEKIKSLETSIQKNGLLFLCEMGLDPGIDHMSAMDLIHRIKNRGGHIHSFKSHTGGLVAPESDNNPWHYKISWNPRNVVLAGSAGAVYKDHGAIVNKNYASIFDDCKNIQINGIGELAYYPNRDSLAYIPIYNLQTTHTFIRTTLRYPAFCKGWKAIVDAGLSNDTDLLDNKNLRLKDWSVNIKPFLNKENLELLSFLGLFSDELVPASAKTSADILQYLLETNLAMDAKDKDMIVMVHELEYTIEDKKYYTHSSLIVNGEDHLRTAMAKTVGLPLGIAATLILKGKLKLTGLHIPILPEIYEPVLAELKNHGIGFEEEEIYIG